MSETFDFVVVGAGSAGAVVAARLSEDPSCRVLLLEAGERPPPGELVPAAVATMQLNPATDWMYTGDAGRAGLGLTDGRMMVPRGKMLGGTSGINYMAYVRGHPGDFDAWAAGGADGWSYADVLPYFRKSEGLTPSDDVVIDAEAHATDGPLGVSVRAPVLPGAAEFVAAAEAAGIPRGDYNGRDRGGPEGVASLLQTSTRAGRRSSTFHAFLEGEAEARENLTIVTGAHVTRVLLSDDATGLVATGVEYRTADGEPRYVLASAEVVLSGGAYGSPQLLLLSGVGPRAELEALGIACAVDSPHVGKHLQDHLHLPLFFQAPGVGVPLAEVGDLVRLRRPALPRRAAARRPGGRREPAAGARGSESRVGPPHRRVGDHRRRPRVVLPLRRRCLVLHRPRRRAYPRRAARLLPVRVQRRLLAARPAHGFGHVLRRPRQRSGAGRGEHGRPGQPRPAAQRGRGHAGQCRPGRAPDDPAELLRRPARPGRRCSRSPAGPWTSSRTGRPGARSAR